jgi:hypothetical protein
MITTIVSVVYLVCIISVTVMVMYFLWKALAIGIELV